MTRDMMREYKDINFQIKDLTKKLDAMKKEIMTEANETGELEKHWQDIGYKVEEKHRSSIDTKALKEAFPEIYEMFVKETVYQALTVK